MNNDELRKQLKVYSYENIDYILALSKADARIWYAQKYLPSYNGTIELRECDVNEEGIGYINDSGNEEFMSFREAIDNEIISLNKETWEPDIVCTTEE